MSLKANIKEKPRNILLIGSKSQTADFIKRFGEFWKSSDVQLNTLKRTPQITQIKEIQPRNCFLMFDEQVCFVALPESMNPSEARYFYKVLLNFKSIDAILVFADDYLSELESYMQFYFIATNYPREKLIFVINRRENKYRPNIMAIIINLENTLKKLMLATKVTENKNLFLMEQIFQSNEMLSFCNRLKDIFILLPCALQFKTDVENLFDKISFVNRILIEILLLNNSLMIFVSNFRNTICKFCSIKKRRTIWCHSRCQCLDDGEDLQNCCTFNTNICKNRLCRCPVEAHISLKYYTIKNFESDLTLSEFERIPILHILATLYLFCKQSTELTEIYKNFKKEYWSLVTLSDITSDNAVYKEIEDKIKEFELNSYKPTAEEVILLLESLAGTTWYSFDMKGIIKTNCKLKIIANTSATISRVTQKNYQKPVRFPEMKSTIQLKPLVTPRLLV